MFDDGRYLMKRGVFDRAVPISEWDDAKMMRFGNASRGHGSDDQHDVGIKNIFISFYRRLAVKTVGTQSDENSFVIFDALPGWREART